MESSPNRLPTRVDVARILLLIQAAIAVVSLLETAVVGAAGGPLGPATLLSAVFATGMLALVAGVGRRSRRARRIVIVVEWIVIAFAAIDLALAGILAHRSLELVPILTRLVLPLSVIRLLRRSSSRREFGIAAKTPKSLEVAS